MPGTKIAEALRREQIISAAYQLARRGGLRAVTVRDVARKGGMSTGLVLFHFGTKERLILALLDFVVGKTTTLTLGPDVQQITSPLDRLIALLRQEMQRLSTESARNRIFFEFWNESMWNRAMRVRMQRDLDRYRAAFHPLAAEVIGDDPERFAGIQAADLAAVAVSFIKGCAIQSIIEPSLDVRGFLSAPVSLLESPSSGAIRQAAVRAGS